MSASREASGSRSLGDRARRGALVSFAGQIAAQGLRLLSNLILSRLLFPEIFGLVAIVNLVLMGLQQVSHVGLQPAIIRHARGEDPHFLNTAWSMQAIRGLLLWIVGMALALPVARLYGEPELSSLLAVAAFSALLSGLFSTNLISATRHLDLGRLTLLELAGQIVALGVMLVLALREPSAWVLVVGGLSAGGVRLVLSHLVMSGIRNRFEWNREDAREIFSFGKWIFVGTLFTFLTMRLDVGLLGKLVPMGVLGVYSIGILLPGIVRDVTSRIIQLVLMPALSESHRGSPDGLAGGLWKARRILLPLGLLAVLGTAILAPAFFEYLYDPRYRDAGWIAQLALIGLWFTLLQESSGRALLALGDSRAWALSNVLKALAAAGGGLLGFWLAGLPGLLLGLAAAALVGHLVVALRLEACGLSILATDLRYSLLGLGLGLATGLGPHLLAERLGVQTVALLTLALGSALLAPYALWTARRVLREGLGEAGARDARAPATGR